MPLPTYAYWVVEGRVRGGKGTQAEYFTGAVEVPDQARPVDFLRALQEMFEGASPSAMPAPANIKTNVNSAMTLRLGPKDSQKYTGLDGLVRHKLENCLAWSHEELKEWKAR